MSELSRHEHDYKYQIGDIQRRLGTQTSRERNTALRAIFRNNSRMAKAKAFGRWRAWFACLMSSRT